MTAETPAGAADRPWRLLLLPPLPAELFEQLFGDPRLELVVPPERTQAAVDALLPEVDLVLGDWSPSLSVGDPGPRVAFVQQPSAGVDGLDLDACTGRGVPVASCAGANAEAVAEWCLTALLALFRKTVQAEAAVRRGEWPQTTLGGRELRGKKIGLIGMGAIGQRLTELLVAVGCPVTYWSRHEHDVEATSVSLDRVLSESDAVVVVVALTAETRGLVGEALLQHGRGAYLVNAARGEVVEQRALLSALEEGRLGGAFLDVFDTEPLPLDSPLREAANVLLSPHTAGSTVEASLAIIERCRTNLLAAIEGDPLVSVVNGVDPVVSRRA